MYPDGKNSKAMFMSCGLSYIVLRVEETESCSLTPWWRAYLSRSHTAPSCNYSDAL